MSDQKAMLEVGDVVYAVGNYGIFRHKIDRVTPTQAITGNAKLKRQIEHNGWISEVSPARWSTINYRIETPELLARYARENNIAKLKDVNLSTLTDEQLTAVLKIVNPTP